MTTTVNRVGVALGLLAICLQVVVCTMGGRLCLQGAATTGEGESSCATVCCDDSGVDLRAAVIGAVVEIASPVLPSNSQCCLKQGREHIAGNLDGPSTRLSTDDLHAVQASVNLHQLNETAPQQSSTALAAISAQPPPTLLALQTTILRI